MEIKTKSTKIVIKSERYDGIILIPTILVERNYAEVNIIFALGHYGLAVSINKLLSRVVKARP